MEENTVEFKSASPKSMSKRNITIFILAVVLFIVSVGGSYILFSQLPGTKPAIPSTPPTQLAGGGLQFDPTLPKTETCPLNGAKYSTQQRAWWEKHEPLGVMIENHEDARPQSGLTFADVVYEAVAEGGITRFLAVFYCQDAPEIGPVRSARTYFIDFASEYGPWPLYAHVGGANADGPANALGQLDDYGWTGYNDLNQFSIGFPTFWRDYNRVGHEVATEHTMYSTTTKLWDFAKTSRGITNTTKSGSWDSTFTKYAFKDDSPAANPTASVAHIEFWQGFKAYFVDWAYDKTQNVYKRSNAGVPHIDFDTKKQIAVKNVVVLWMKELGANDGYENNIHLLYQDKGTGKATIFMDGKQIIGTWRKDKRTSRTLVFDANGNPVQFNRGEIWFTVLPLDGVLVLK